MEGYIQENDTVEDESSRNYKDRSFLRIWLDQYLYRHGQIEDKEDDETDDDEDNDTTEKKLKPGTKKWKRFFRNLFRSTIPQPNIKTEKSVEVDGNKKYPNNGSLESEVVELTDNTKELPLFNKVEDSDGSRIAKNVLTEQEHSDAAISADRDQKYTEVSRSGQTIGNVVPGGAVVQENMWTTKNTENDSKPQEKQYYKQTGKYSEYSKSLFMKEYIKDLAKDSKLSKSRHEKLSKRTKKLERSQADQENKNNLILGELKINHEENKNNITRTENIARKINPPTEYHYAKTTDLLDKPHKNAAEEKVVLVNEIKEIPFPVDILETIATRKEEEAAVTKQILREIEQASERKPFAEQQYEKRHEVKDFQPQTKDLPVRVGNILPTIDTIAAANIMAESNNSNIAPQNSGKLRTSPTSENATDLYTKAIKNGFYVAIAVILLGFIILAITN